MCHPVFRDTNAPRYLPVEKPYDVPHTVYDKKKALIFAVCGPFEWARKTTKKGKRTIEDPEFFEVTMILAGYGMVWWDVQKQQYDKDFQKWC